MTLGYDGKLYILAFDHRGSFQKKMFGIEGDPTPEQTETIADAKHLIFEGMLKADRGGRGPASATGALVDEQFGGDIPSEAKERGLKLAMPVEKSGQNEFDFQYGDDFGEHIEQFDPDFSKVLVRYNPDGDAEMNQRQAERLKRLVRLAPRERPQVPVRAAGARRGRTSSSRSAATTDRYDAELRPELMRRAIIELQDAGIEADIWKIEGIDAQEDCELIARRPLAATAATASSAWCSAAAPTTTKVDHWLRQAAPVEGYVGFAIGRTIWWDALKGFLDGSIERDDAAEQIADNYLRFVEVYDEAARSVSSDPALTVRRPPGLGVTLVAFADAMRMRQSLAQFEAAFREEAAESVVRRERLRKQAAQRSRVRRVERRVKQRARCASRCSSLAIIVTAVIVTIVMFQTLAMLAG